MATIAPSVERAWSVSLDAEHLAAGVLGIEPVEERGTRAADMQIAGRRGCKTRDDRFAHAVGELLD